MHFFPQSTKPVKPNTVDNHQTWFAACNFVFLNVGFVLRGWVWPPCWSLHDQPFSLVKGQREAYSKAWRDFWRREHWWRTVSGLIKRITFPSEDPGGWLLPAAVRQVPNPVKTRPNRWTDGQSPGNWVPSPKLKLICSSSAQITSFFQGYLLWFHFFILAHISLCFMRLIYFPNHSLASSSLSLLLSPQRCFSLKFTLHFLWTHSKSVSCIHSCSAEIQHSLTALTSLASLCSPRWDSCGTEVSDLWLWTSGGC